MPNLASYPVYKQAEPTSCWACAARSIMNYNYGTPRVPLIGSDQELADMWADRTKDPKHGKIDIEQSASAALHDLGVENNIDGRPFPTIDEIIEQIDLQRPMLAIIGKKDPKGTPDKAYQDGHWLVVTGADKTKNKIRVFDPDNGKENEVDYDDTKYKGYGSDNFWENTSYIGPVIVTETL